MKFNFSHYYYYCSYICSGHFLVCLYSLVVYIKPLMYPQNDIASQYPNANALGEYTHNLFKWPTCRHGREIRWWWPTFVRFMIGLGPYFMPHHDLIDPIFLQKTISLSLSHLVLEILVHNVGLIFHWIVLFNNFQAFCINFLRDVWSNWPSFPLILDFVDPSFIP